jgi:uncharacterized UBP type Zn finger protein
MTQELPKAVKACLWSYDVTQIDLSNPDHKQRVIENVLNYGTIPALNWLLAHMSREDIAEAITHSRASVWNKKSISLWSLVFGVIPARKARFA